MKRKSIINIYSMCRYHRNFSPGLVDIPQAVPTTPKLQILLSCTGKPSCTFSIKTVCPEVAASMNWDTVIHLYVLVLRSATNNDDTLYRVWINEKRFCIMEMWKSYGYRRQCFVAHDGAMFFSELQESGIFPGDGRMAWHHKYSKLNNIGK